MWNVKTAHLCSRKHFFTVNHGFCYYHYVGGTSAEELLSYVKKSSKTGVSGCRREMNAKSMPGLLGCCLQSNPGYENIILLFAVAYCGYVCRLLISISDEQFSSKIRSSVGSTIWKHWQIHTGKSQRKHMDMNPSEDFNHIFIGIALEHWQEK